MNKRILILLLSIIFTTLRVYAEKEFKDVIVTKKYVCALTAKGTLKFYDKLTGRPSGFSIKYATEIKSITTDKAGSLVIADKDNSIKKYNDKKQTWELILTAEENLFGVLFDSKNQCFGITEKGILSSVTNKTYYSTTSLNRQIRYKGKWQKLYCFYIDKADKIWLGFGYGEWGGDLFVFETTQHEFLTPQLDSPITLKPVKSFFEDDKFTYLSSGLQHMITSGTILKFDNLKAQILFTSKSKWSEPLGKERYSEMIDGEYIGPATYNKFNNSIYFYSQNGFFKGDTTKDLSKIENWLNILNPELHWTDGQPDAVGSPMNVLKILIIEKEKFLFLTQKDGIGFYDGKKLKMLE